MRSLPPLVDPASDLTSAELERYSRQTILPELGELGQRRLKNARVLVIGAGGLGSPLLLYLAAAGIGTLGVVDFDEVELSNLARQVIHGTRTVGSVKTESVTQRLSDLAPDTQVIAITEAFSPANAVSLCENYDILVDGSDNFATRYLANDAAVISGIPYVWGSVHRFSGQVSVFWDRAPQGRGIDYRDLYPEPPAEGTVPNCAEGGVLGVVCAVIGSLMGAEVIKLITGIGEPLLGTLVLYDALVGSTRTVSVRRNPNREVRREIKSPHNPHSERVVPLRPSELKELLNSNKEFLVVDVREQDEWNRGHIEGARHIPLSQLEKAIREGDLPKNLPLVVYCARGPRSTHAVKILQSSGLHDVKELKGGFIAWEATA